MFLIRWITDHGQAARSFLDLRDREHSVLYYQSVRPWMRFPRMSRAFYRRMALTEASLYLRAMRRKSYEYVITSSAY